MDIETEVWPFEGMEELARKAECYETPEWAVDAILKVELLSPCIIDPCCGRGILAERATAWEYGVEDAFDLYDWGYKRGKTGIDFLEWHPPEDPWNAFPSEFSVLMNPPFSKAEAFVEHALLLGARKVLCFQRFAWWESRGRQEFWERYAPNRIYVCESRANCWRIDIPPWKRTSSTPTAHAWFVWEPGQPRGTLLGRLKKEE